jgi:deoxyxylulose-5-phosphate synthase
VSVWLGITGQREIYVLLFGGMGIVSLIAYLLVRPMQGVRDALSDFLQAHITFDTANQQIGAWHPKYFMPKDIHEVQQVSDTLQGIRESSARLLEHVLEQKGTELTRKGG